MDEQGSNGEHARLERQIAQVSTSCHDLYELSARLEKGQEVQTTQLSEIFALLRRQPCEKHLTLIEQMDKRGTTALAETVGRVAALEQQMERVSAGSQSRRPPSSEQRPRTGGGHPAISQRDLEESQEHVIAELEGRAERAAEATAANVVRQMMDRIAELEAAKGKAKAEFEATLKEQQNKSRAEWDWRVNLASKLVPC
jgi:DNA anti-recombination protein RmuC